MELVESEVKYVDFLRTLHDHFYIRLTGLETFERPILSKNQIRVVFMNLEGIYAMSLRLRDDLVKLRYEGIKEVVEGVGEVMKKYIPYMRLYIDYVGRYPQSMKLLEDLEKDKKWMEFKEISEWCCKRELGSLMIMPIQRMPRYVMFLKELHNSASSKSSKDILEVSQKLQEVAWHINSQSKRLQARKMVVDLQEEIFADQYRLVNPTRYFILQGDLKKVHNKGANILRRTESYLFILFNDILIYASRTAFESKHAKFRHALPLDKISIKEDGDQSRNKLKSGEIGFYIETAETSSAKSFLVLAPDEASRGAWMEKIRNAADKHCEDINTLRREPQTVEQIESEITKSVKEERAPDLPTPTPNPLAAAGSSAAGTGSTTPRQHSRKQSSMVAAAAAAAAATAGSGKRGEGVVPSDPPKLSQSESEMEHPPEMRHLTQINDHHGYPATPGAAEVSNSSSNSMKRDRSSPQKSVDKDIDVPPFTRSASEPPFAAVDREGGGRASPATPHIERERGRPLKARAFDDKSHVHKPKSKRSSLAHSPSPFHKRDRSRERGPFASQGRSRRYGSDAHASVSGAGGVSPPGPSPPSSRPNTREREREQHSKPIGSLYARHTEDEQFASSSRIHGARKSWSESSSGRGAGGGGSHHRLVSEINPSSWKGGNQPRTSSQRHGNSGLSSLPPPSSSSNPNRRVTSTNGVKTSGRLPIVRSRSDSCGSARSGRSDDDTGPFTTNSERTKSGSRTPFSAIRLGVNGVLGGADTDTQRHHRSSSHSHSSENRSRKLRASSLGSTDGDADSFVPGGGVGVASPTPAVTPRATSSAADRSVAPPSYTPSDRSRSEPRAVSAQARVRRLSRTGEYNPETGEIRRRTPFHNRQQARLSNKGPAPHEGAFVPGRN